MHNRGAAAWSTLPLILALTLTSATGAQVDPTRVRDRALDSLVYLRDSAVVDSIARHVPTDSLRALYRRVATGPDPVAAAEAIRCEGYRLWYTYGHAAEIAEERVRAAEWTPDRDSAVIRALDAAHDDLRRRIKDHLLRGITFRDTVCVVADDAPRVVERLRTRPQYPPRHLYIPRGSTRDALRRLGGYFEGTLSAKLASGDTTIEYAGTAGLYVGSYLSVHLDDRLHSQRTLEINMQRIGPELLSPGSYPIFGDGDLRWVRDVISADITTLTPVLIDETFDKWWGTLVVDRADSTEVHGQADIWIHRKGLHVRRAYMPTDSLRDTIHVSVRFRAPYGWDRQWSDRAMRSLPDYPHRLVREKAPDAAMTARRLFLDERVPCEHLPIYSPESALPPLPATYGRPVARAMLNIRPDTSGKVGGREGWRDLSVLAIDDTSLVATFYDLTGIRFRKTHPDQVFARVRCTLTLRRER